MIASNPSIKYDDHKIESYKEKLQNFVEDFQNRFKDFHSFKSFLGFIVNPFLIDIISDGYQLHQTCLKK